jgi:hypothetical protein
MDLHSSASSPPRSYGASGRGTMASNPPSRIINASIEVRPCGPLAEQQRRGLLGILKSRFGERKNSRTRQKGGSFSQEAPRVIHKHPHAIAATRETVGPPPPSPGAQAQPLRTNTRTPKAPAASANTDVRQQSSERRGYPGKPCGAGWRGVHMGTGVPHEGLSTSAIEGETEVSGPWCKRRD